MGIETKILLILPMIFGALIICFTEMQSPVYMRHSNRQRHAFIGILLVAPIFVYGLNMIGLRPLDAGNDTERYIRAYEQLNGLSSAAEIGRRTYGNTELLWWPIQSALKAFLSPRGWLIANYLLVFGFAALYYKKAARPLGMATEMFALIFLTFFLVYAGNIMRQTLAVPIGALGFLLFFERRHLAASALIGISIGLHWSCIIFLAAPVFLARAFDRKHPYWIIPLLALSLSALSSRIIGDALGILGIQELTAKFDLYFSGNQESHVGAVWKTANFWICSFFSMAYILIAEPATQGQVMLRKYTLLCLSLVFFGINTADFSERYMPFLLFVLPLQAASLFDQLRAPTAVKNFLYLGFFLSLGVLVFAADSSQHTLGYTL